MPSTGAADWIRDAVLTTSPVTKPSPSSGRASSATSASPVLMPMRTVSARSGSDSFSSCSRSMMPTRRAPLARRRPRAQSEHRTRPSPRRRRTSRPSRRRPRSARAATRGTGAAVRVRPRVSRLRRSREPDQVAEQHGHDLPLLRPPAAPAPRADNGAAHSMLELRALGILMRAGRARRHARDSTDRMHRQPLSPVPDRLDTSILLVPATMESPRIKRNQAAGETGASRPRPPQPCRLQGIATSPIAPLRSQVRPSCRRRVEIRRADSHRARIPEGVHFAAASDPGDGPVSLTTTAWRSRTSSRLPI